MGGSRSESVYCLWMAPVSFTRWLTCVVLACTTLAAQTPDPPSRDAWRRWVETREGPEPFSWAEDKDGLVRVKIPTGWRAESERTRDKGVRLFAIPPDADPAAPREAFLLFLVPVPAADRTTMDAVAIASAEHFAKLRMPSRSAALPPTREVAIDGDRAWEIPIEPEGSPATGYVRARGGDRAIAVSVHHAAPWSPVHRSLYELIDASLEFRLFAPRLVMWIPASWKGEAIALSGGRTAIAVGPRSLEVRPDKSAPRLVIATLEGPDLAGFDARTVAQNKALNIQLDHAKSPQPRELVRSDALSLGGVQAAREVLRGPAAGDAPACEVWIVVAKETAAKHAELWMIYGSPESLAREGPRLRAMLENARLTPHVPEPARPDGSGS